MLSNLNEFHKQLMYLIHSSNPSFKQETIKINISSSFMARAKCFVCKTGPEYFIYEVKPYPFWDYTKSAKYFAYMQKYIGLNNNWFSSFHPKEINRMSYLFFTLQNKSVSARSHQHNIPLYNQDYIDELASCACGSHIWFFNQKSVKNQPEIVNRKGKYKYPKLIFA